MPRDTNLKVVAAPCSVEIQTIEISIGREARSSNFGARRNASVGVDARDFAGRVEVKFDHCRRELPMEGGWIWKTGG